MNPEKVGSFIREIRKKNNLSQQKFASKYGVTYQAVSKWENGKNIPDILLLKQICNDFNLKIDDLLDGNNVVNDKEKVDNKKNKLIFFGSISFMVIVVIILLIFISHDHDFKFKTLTTGCSDFNVSGSVAYNENKSSIYISNINYCGIEDSNKYKKIECALYEEINNTKVLVTSCETGENLTLNDFLNDLKLGVDDYKQNCKNFIDNRLYLEISATDELGKVTLFEVPLSLEDNCKF